MPVNRRRTPTAVIEAISDPQEAPVGIVKRAKNFRILNGLLYKVNTGPTGTDDLLAIPRHLIAEVLFSHHSESMSGHLGITKTLYKISHRFYWRNLGY